MGYCAVAVHCVFKPFNERRIQMKCGIMTNTIHSHVGPKQRCIFEISCHHTVFLGEISQRTQVFMPITKTAAVISTITESMEPPLSIILRIGNQIFYKPVSVIIIGLTISSKAKEPSSFRSGSYSLPSSGVFPAVGFISLLV